MLPAASWKRGKATEPGQLLAAMMAVAFRVPIPKFALLCGTLVCELRNRRTLATYRSSVALVQKSAFRSRRKNNADF